MDLSVDYAETRRAAHRLDRHACELRHRASPREPDIGPPDDGRVEGDLAEVGHAAQGLALRLSRLSSALDALERGAGLVDDEYAARLLLLGER